MGTAMLERTTCPAEVCTHNGSGSWLQCFSPIGHKGDHFDIIAGIYWRRANYPDDGGGSVPGGNSPDSPAPGKARLRRCRLRYRAAGIAAHRPYRESTGLKLVSLDLGQF